MPLSANSSEIQNAPRPLDHSRAILQVLKSSDPSLLGLPHPLVDGSTLSDAIDDRVQTLPHEAVTALNRDCILSIESNARHGAPGRPMSTPEFSLLCHGLLSCETLEEALRKATSYFDMLDGRAGRLTVHQYSDTLRIDIDIWRSPDPASTLFMDVYGFRSLHRLFGWLIGEAIPVFEATVIHPRSRIDHAVQLITPGPLRYNQPRSSFSFPASFLKRTNVRTREELTSLLEFFPFDLQPTTAHTASLADKVRAHCVSALLRSASMPDMASLASTFGQASATLRRRLRQEGTSLQKIKQECSFAQAARDILSTRMGIDEIAARSGYRSKKRFTAAFRQRTGMSPTEYRRARPADDPGLST